MKTTSLKFRRRRPADQDGEHRGSGQSSERSFADVVEQLFGDYDGRHSLKVIGQVALECRAKLSGPTGRAAPAEQIQQSAAQRLDAMPPTAHPHRIGAGVRATRARLKVRRLRHEQQRPHPTP